MLDVSDHADYLAPGRIDIVEAHALANDVLPGPIARGHRLVDDDDQRSQGIVRRSEGTAFANDMPMAWK